jgi:DNA-binding transcriptional LysR family regulator
MTPELDWDELRVFLALARARSARGAAALLKVSHSTVTRRVEALEARLGVRLFDRSRDGYALTDAGVHMQTTAERIEGDIAALTRTLAGGDERLSGTVSVTCCDRFVSGLLVEALCDFFNAYPALDLELSVDSRSFDLSRREADMAVRILVEGTPPPQTLIARRLAPLNICGYVGRAHVERLDPAGPNARWLGMGDASTEALVFPASGYPDLPIWGAFLSLDGSLQAAAAGLGFALLPTYVGDPHPDVVRLPHAILQHVANLWLLSHPDLRDTARLRATRRAIEAAFARRIHHFDGRWFVDAPTRSENTPSASPGPSLG